MTTIWINNRKSSKTDEAVTKKLPKLSRDAFTKLINQPNVRVITDDSVASALARHRRNAKINLADLKKKLGANSPLYREIVRMPDSEKPVTQLLQNGVSRQFSLINRDTLIFDLVRNSAVTHSRLNQYRIYQAIYDNITDNTQLSGPLLAEFNSLMKPAKARLLKAADLKAEVANLVQLGLKIPFIVTYNPAAKPSECGNEIGTGQGGDSCGNMPTIPAANGLLQNADWPLKKYTTCVRDQGDRGTCVAFGIVGAVESAIAVHHDRFVNLSEQDLYRHFKLDWYPLPSDYYGDGYNGINALLYSVATRYVFPFEKDWDYNPSFNRHEDDAARDYDFSCVATGSCAAIGDCSNTNHQAKRTCYQVEEEVVRTVIRTVSRWIEGIADVIDTVAGWFGVDTQPIGQWVEEQVTEIITEILTIRVCVYDDDELATSSRFYIPYGVPVFDALDSSPLGRDFGLDLAKLFLNCRIPIVFGFRSVDSFKNSVNGYVTYNKDEKPDGGHAVLMTGFIRNEDLPAGAPHGDGGGYFIIKNSWATTYGDCGYSYLPYDWVKKWGKYLVGVPYVGER